MVHNAFDARCIVKNSSVRIESAIIPAPGRVIAGCTDGSLRIYEQQDEDDDEEQHRQLAAEYSIKRTVVGFAKKPVTQMDVCQSRGGMLITLADAVSIHSLAELEPVAYLQKTKGATLFCWDEHRAVLCVARNKRLLVYRHDGSREFSEAKDFALSDAVKTMAWSGDSLCIGLKREYAFLNINTGATTDIFPCGRIAAPSITSLPGEELLLGKDNIGVFVDQNGRVSRQGALSWSEAPSSVVAFPPYVLARFPRFIEVRSVRESYGLVQIIPVRDIQFFQMSSFGLLAVSERSVYKMEPVALGVQVVQLAASGNFDDALALCKMFPPEDAALRSSKEDGIHIRYGQFLLSRGQYADALQHFAMSSLSLSSIISLFPSIKLPRFCADEVSKDTENSEDFYAAAADGKNEEDGMKNSSALSLGALVNFLSTKRATVIEKAKAQDTSDAVAELVEGTSGRKSNKAANKEAIAAPRKMAIVLDTALVQALLLTNQSPAASQLLKDLNYCDVEACQEMMQSGGFFKELLELYRYNKMYKEALELLTRLFEAPDSFPVPPQPNEFGSQYIVDYLKPLGSEAPKLLADFSSLILKASPEQAMELFTSTNPPLPANLVLSELKKHAPELQVVYMEEMVKHNPGQLSPEIQNDLVQLYLARVMDERAQLQTEGKWEEREHTEARKKLLEALDGFSSYSPQAIFRRLPEDGLYEERALLFGKMQQHQLALSIYVHKLHDAQTALAYCDRVYESSRVRSKSVNPIDQEGGNIYSALLEIYLKPKSSIREFDASAFKLGLGGPAPRTERATTRTRGHVAKKVTRIAEAQNYGTSDGGGIGGDMTESGRSDTEEMFDTRVAADAVMLKEAINLLSYRWDCFDAAQVLRMLPSDAKLQDLLPFLEPLLRRSTERSRNAAIIRGVQYSDNVEVRYELLQRRKRAIKVTSDRLCSICRKKILMSVFAVYPSGALAHFGCYSDRSKAS